MESPGTHQPAAEQRKILRLVFQLVGVADVALGLAVAVWGPGFVGGDPLVETVIVIGGADLALGGLAMIWFARRRFGGDRAGGSAGLVVRTRN